MSEEDDQFLKEMNEKAPSKNAATRCSEDQFEEVMNFFEMTAKAQQPYGTVGDTPPILTWEEMFNSFDENIDEPARVFAKDIYEYWKTSRSQNSNAPLQPSLKVKVIETANDNDDNDPFVCFRRREVRQARKTRGRDAQSVEKLKKLRKELEEARQLVALVKQRELLKRDSLAVDKQLYEQRASLRQVKKKLPDPYRDGDEELLINQRVSRRSRITARVMLKSQKPKKPAPTAGNLPSRGQGTSGRPPLRPDGRSSDADLVLLSDMLAEKENAVQREIKDKIRQHQKWNEHYVDLTRQPLTPPPEENFNSFRPAVTEYLPTPPASDSSEHSENAMEVNVPRKQEAVSVRYAAPSPNSPNKDQPAFRRRIGRGGRILIDRRGMQPQSKTVTDSKIAERFRYDDDGDDDDEHFTYTLDPYDISSMRYRAAISGSHPAMTTQQAQAMRRAQIEQQQAEAAKHGSQAAAAGSASQGGHRIAG